MPEVEEPLPWTAPGWQEQVLAWVTPRLLEHGCRVNGPFEQPHIRPWSAVLRVPTDHGPFFFKACSPVLAHEVGLVQALYHWRPDCIQTILAADLSRALLLMPDESPLLRALINIPSDNTRWETILPLYAGLQQEMISRKTELLALGILDRRLATLPAQFEGLLQDRQAMLIGQQDGLSNSQYDRLVALLPRYAEMCARLAAYGIPETLHHDDLHDGNIFVPSGRYVISDWAESCVTHPFFSMLVTLRSIAYRFDLPYGSREHDFQWAPELSHLRDLYLSSWSSYGSVEKLRPVFDLAWRAAMVNRALTWHRAISHLSREDQGREGTAVPAWLNEFLDMMDQVPE